MIPIPEELLEQLGRGNVLFFIGECIVLDTEGRAVIDRLTSQVTAGCGVADDEIPTFPEAAQAYEHAFGRHALVKLTRDELADLSAQPQTFHELIAELTTCKVLVTTCLDRRLERAIRDIRRPLSVVVRNKDVAFADDRAVQIFKLRGSVEQPDSLLLTSDDYEAFEQQATTSLVLLVLQGYLARKTIVFLGYDLADPHFRRLYRKTIDPLDTYARQSYALFTDPPSPSVSLWCERRGIQLLQIEAVEFLEALVARQAAYAKPVSVRDLAPMASLPERPYKFLDYYESGDAAIFFGRRSETLELMSLIHAHRLTLLYGASGTGKTSLLLAGAVPRLEEADPPYKIIYVRALEDPALVIRREVRRKLPKTNLPQEGLLVDFLDVATRALNRTLVIVLDQFEEFFIRLSPEFRAAFIDDLGALYDARDVPVKAVLSLREDWLAAVGEIEERIPEVFRIRMRLLPLTREQARQAIVEPMEKLGMGYEPALVDQLLDDLAGAQGTSVMPPQLQLVCDALYRHARDDGRRVITSHDYEAVGNAQGVLSRYLQDELARLASDEQALARTALRELVTSQGTKAVKASKELALTLSVGQSELEPILEKLVRARLLRVLEEEGGGIAYELAHEHLITEITTWIEESEMQVKLAGELLRREMESWQGLGKLIDPAALHVIHEQRNELHRLSAGVMELLFRSALAAGIEVAYWFERASQSGVVADQIALEGVKSESFHTRAAAVAVLGELGEQFAESLIPALADDHPQVRAAAIRALERMQPDGAWRARLKYECYVPAGEFIMGGNHDAHRVHVGSFYIAKHPVTNTDYKCYMDSIGRTFEIPRGKADHPLVEISWYDARDYATWAGMRLLTEAEWEKAASWEGFWKSDNGGRKHKYPWGDEFNHNWCNTVESGIGRTTPVGSYSPQGDSPYGCADMAGNVWEWTSSLYQDYPYRADDGREDLHSSNYRVLRGGSFNHDENAASTTFRDWYGPFSQSWNNGVRLGLSAPLSLQSSSTETPGRGEISS